MTRFEPYKGGALGGRVGLGRRPAVLVVDLVRGFTDPASPLGADLDEVVAATRVLLDEARAVGMPIVFTTIAFAPDGVEGGVWRRKMPGLDRLVEGSPLVEVDERLARRESEPLVVKRAASAFTATGLTSLLVSLGVDSLIVTGATTSGCVRATVVDACMAGYPTVVPVEGVGDRHAAAHDANLFDIDAKYGDVIPLGEAVNAIGAGPGPHQPAGRQAAVPVGG